MPSTKCSVQRYDIYKIENKSTVRSDKGSYNWYTCIYSVCLRINLRILTFLLQKNACLTGAARNPRCPGLVLRTEPLPTKRCFGCVEGQSNRNLVYGTIVRSVPLPISSLLYYYRYR